MLPVNILCLYSAGFYLNALRKAQDIFVRDMEKTILTPLNGRIIRIPKRKKLFNEMKILCFG